MHTHPRRLCGGFVTDYFTLLIFRKLFRSWFVYWCKWTPAEIPKWIPNQINSSSPARPMTGGFHGDRTGNEVGFFSHYPIHLSPCLAISNPPPALYSLFPRLPSTHTYDYTSSWLCLSPAQKFLPLTLVDDITALPVLWGYGWGHRTTLLLLRRCHGCTLYQMLCHDTPP